MIASELPLLTGELAHRCLEEWNFSDDPAGFQAGLGPFLERWVKLESNENRERLRQELEEIFDLFFSSTAYRELSSARILGREVPLLIPWDGGIMEGVIDLLYEKEGLLYLADYKTDRITPEELPRTAESYHHQVRIYSEAARQSLHRDVAGFKLIFLRLGRAVELPRTEQRDLLAMLPNPV
jgi:ATP-dependent exoDNAse (exonuclease V) beta subunit